LFYGNYEHLFFQQLRGRVISTFHEANKFLFHPCSGQVSPTHPEAAQKIDPRNVRRTMRALEVILTTGRKFSAQRGQGKSPYHLISIGLTRPRPELYARIDARIESMFENGLLDEVKRLLEIGCSPTLPTMSAIGYRECVNVVKGQMGIEEAKVGMRRATRIFVRRQSNWFKESDPDIHWFYAGEENVIENIVNLIRRAIPE